MPGPYLIDVDKVEEVEPALEKALQYPMDLIDATRALCSDLHSFRDGCSSERVLNAVNDFVTVKQGGLRKKPLNLLRKFKVRRRLRRELRSSAPHR